VRCKIIRTTKTNESYRRAFGGGGSFETVDFSLPSYDAVTSGGNITKSSALSSATAALKVNDSAAMAAAREEREASRRAEAEAKEAQKKADEVAAKEVADKAAGKEAAKEDCKVREQSLAFFICYGAVDSFFFLIECDASSHAKNE
jgi:hypothetical protein